MDDHGLWWCGITWSKRPIAHLSFDAAQIAPAAAARDALLQDLLKHALMKGLPLHRGK